MLRTFFISVIVFALIRVSVMAEPAPLENLAHDNKLALGERMCRQGILPSGEPMQAMVAADVPVDG